jgi:hypothetical protein
MSEATEMRLHADVVRRLEIIEADARRREEMQQQRHEENTQRLYRIEKETTERVARIEKVLTEASVYFKLGRWTMHILMAIGGGLIVAILAKWAGVKP